MIKFYVIIVMIFAMGLGLGFLVNVSGEESSIPSWVKNTARWWADGQVGDEDFINGLQYLVNHKILVIPPSNNSKTSSQDEPVPDTWSKVIELTSSVSKKTDTFKISGEKWRFTWSCKAENEYDAINITVFKPNSDIPVEMLLVQKCPPVEETSYVYKGSGEYYFNVMGANIGNWTIKVEEFF